MALLGHVPGMIAEYFMIPSSILTLTNNFCDAIFLIYTHKD